MASPEIDISKSSNHLINLTFNFFNYIWKCTIAFIVRVHIFNKNGLQGLLKEHWSLVLLLHNYNDNSKKENLKDVKFKICVI